jgi:hypothetical protein
MLACADLLLDDAIQPRERLDDQVLREYTENYTAAEPDHEPFPPLDVFDVGGTYYVADGFHRLEAARRADRATVPCHVHQGSKRDAMVFACFANVRRGLRYQHGDWGRILERLLADPEIAQRGDRQLATELGVSHTHVWGVRRRVQAEARLKAELAQLPTTATTPQARAQEQLAQHLGVPVQALKDLAAQEPGGGYPGTLRGATTPQLIKTLVQADDLSHRAPHDRPERSPRQAAQHLAEEIIRVTTEAPEPLRARPSRAKEAVAARRAAREQEALERLLRSLLYQCEDIYPWPVDEDGNELGVWEAEVTDTPALHARAQAMVATVLPRDEEYGYKRWKFARLVFAALDAAWQARMADTTR